MGRLSIKEFKTCPICGHHGWCGSAPADDNLGAVLYYCHYQDGPRQAKVIGIDGKQYVCIKENSEGDGWILETAEQWEESRNRWLMENRKNSNFPVCPICGQEASCTALPSKGSRVPNAKTYFCHGEFSGGPGKQVIGKDGAEYRLIKKAKSGAWMMETMEQYRESVRLWKEQKDHDRMEEPAEKPAEKPHAPEVRVMVNPHENEGEDDSVLLPNAELDRVYDMVIRMLHLIPEHREKLLHDGWTDELIQKYHVVTMPVSDKERWNMEHSGKRSSVLSLPWRYQVVRKLQEEYQTDLSGIPGFYLGKKVNRQTGEITEEWRMAGAAGMMFFNLDVHGHKFGAEIRLDNPNGKGKYRAWSTNPGATNDSGDYLYPGGTKLVDQAGIIYNPETDSSYVAYITEGIKKAVIGNAYKHCPFVVLKGVGKINCLTHNTDENLIMIDYLKKIGVKMLLFAFDSDKVTNENVLKHETRGITLMKEQGFQVGVADWTQHRAYAKGIDDLLVQGLDCSYIPV